MKKRFYISVPFVVVGLSSLLLLGSLDGKVFDLFLRALPSLTENESVLLINVDDTSIENVGIFPWTRDILADAIVFLKEMGAASVAFDLSYLEKSPEKVDPAYVREELPQYLDYNFSQLESMVTQVMDGFSSGMLNATDASDMKEQMLDIQQDTRDALSSSIAYVTRDVDTYFAGRLRLFDTSWLTLTMVYPDMIKDQEFVSDYDMDWLEQHIALKNIEVVRDSKTPAAAGIIPAIFPLLSQARGAGFVNADPDADGYRRRVHLLATYNDQYYAQFAFAPLLDRLGNPRVRVSNSSIVLEGASIDGIVQTIRIPRARDGSMLVQWPKKDYKDYKHISAWDLIRVGIHEKIIAKNLKNLEDSGFFNYWEYDETPLQTFNNANYIRDALSTTEQAREDGTAEQEYDFGLYKEYRESFIRGMNKFLDGSYEAAILADIGTEDSELVAYVHESFESLKDQYTRLLEMRSYVQERAVNAFCIIGVDATSMTDSGLTTFQEHFPNVGIHATIANMILSQEFLDDSPAIISILWALALSLLLGFAISKLDTKRSLLVGLAVLLFSVVSLLLIFIITRRYIGVVVPFTSSAFTFLILTGVTYYTTVREKSFLRNAFSRYLSPEVINQIIADPSRLNLGGEKREMTAMFTDIRGFSTIAEKMDPAELVNLLNMYLTEMSNIILANQGTIDKYEGDAIIAFWGAPLPAEDHAVLACKTAIRMKQAEDRLNERVSEAGLVNDPIFTRIGMNTGDMVVGNMGTANKMDYTIMGNAVNLAARLEGVNKQYNTGGILISEYTRSQIGDMFALRRLDRVRVVGVNTPIRLFELLGIAEELDATVLEMQKLWETAIDLYEQRNFLEAENLFNVIMDGNANDKVAELYVSRCKEFLASKPAEDWDGVFNLTKK